MIQSHRRSPITVIGATGQQCGASTFTMATHDDLDGPARQVAHGRTVALAATQAQLPFMDYSPVRVTDRRSGIPHFGSKGRIEEFSWFPT